MKQKRLKSLTQADVSDLKMPIITIYSSPEDMPGQIVARIFDCHKPTDTYAVYPTLGACRRDLAKAGYTVCIKRSANDVPAIVESWM